MNNRISLLFNHKPKNILSVFFTAGHPYLNSTVDIIECLERKGVDMVEIGLPFSDPMADGPVIQASSNRAIENGITVKKILADVAEARKKVTGMPFILMGYINPIMQYGFSRFFQDAELAGVDGLIIPDLPFDDYMAEFQELSRKHNIDMIMLITPETSAERIRRIDRECDGFIYMVSSASTTGTKERFSEEQIESFHRINAMNLVHPRLIGFGISNPATLAEAFENSSGAIIGSLFIKCLESSSTVDEAVDNLLEKLGC